MTETTREAVYRLHEEGLTQADIARQIGVSPSRVGLLVREKKRKALFKQLNEEAQNTQR